MAGAEAGTMMLEGKILHPLFTNQHHAPPAKESNLSNSGSTHMEQHVCTISAARDDYTAHEEAQCSSTATRINGYKGKENRLPNAPRQSTLKDFVQGNGHLQDALPARPSYGMDGAQDSTDNDLDQNPNLTRRKRRRTTPPEAHEDGSNNRTCDAQKPGGEDGRRGSTRTPSWHEQLATEAAKLPLSMPESRVSSKGELQATSVNVQESNTKPVATSRTSHLVTPTSSEKQIPSAPQNDATDAEDAKANVDPGSADAEDLRVNPQITPLKRASKRKVMKLNASGTLGSPGSDRSQMHEPEAKAKRPRRKKPNKQSDKLMVVMKYDKDGSVGERIEEVASTAGSKVVPKKGTPRKQDQPLGPPKPTHPFFLGKVVKVDFFPTSPQKSPTKISTGSPSQPRTRRRQATATPMKLMAQAQAAREKGEHSSLGKAFARPDHTRSLKYPGTREAPWPERSMVHVRDQGVCNGPELSLLADRSHARGLRALPGNRKMKHRAIQVPEHDDMLSTYIRSLGIGKERHHEQQILRRPERILMTGAAIQKLVQDKFRIRLPPQPPPGLLDDASDSDIESARRPRVAAHPALVQLHESIQPYLTPFDRGICESEAWVNKYAPKTAAQVLRTSKEPVLLRDWLKGLTVTSVGSIHPRKATGPSPKKQKAAKKAKKRKKPEDLDDFLVSSEDESDTIDTLLDTKGLAGDSSSPWQKHTVIRPSGPKSLSGTRSNKTANAMLLSGPHGCGKTATVYAVAEELGFEVFEINPGGRRSGKDILDRVGDMAENHLVHRDRRGSLTADSETDVEKHSEAVKKDIESGRQGTMKSFFKTKTQLKSKAKRQASAKGAAKTKETSAAKPTFPPKPKVSRHQKQSLILLEEVDVLFEEDKQFWFTVLQLASQSRRPIVMTCNDESLVPLQTLPLHGILRLNPPSPELAVDYLLLLAAREGHILDRTAVSGLYDSRQHDLRASIMELDFWCQMAVGDRKGGLEWIYQRWPPGTDVDEQGRPWRVVSEGTYLLGMNWLSHDIGAATEQELFDPEPHLTLQACDNWNAAPEDCTGARASMKMLTAESDGEEMAKPNVTLQALDHYLDAVSAADVYGGVASATGYNILVDPTLPPLSATSRQHFTVEPPLLEAEPRIDQTGRTRRLTIDTHLLAYHATGLTTPCTQRPPLEHALIGTIRSSVSTTPEGLTHADFAHAFDPIADPPATYPACSGARRPPATLAADVAPYVRAIVSHELSLEQQRVHLSSLLSEGGRAKRLRTTRASRSAWEGGERGAKRKERWFGKEFNRAAAMRTGGEKWSGIRDGMVGDAED